MSIRSKIAALGAGLALVLSLGGAPAAQAANVGGIEAEAMTSAHSSSVYSDAKASGGKALKVSANVTARGTVSSAAGADALWVRAHTDPHSGAARVTITIDGVTAAKGARIALSGWGSYKFTGSWSAGKHVVEIAFTNSCCRKLYLDRVNFASSADAPVVAAPEPAPSEAGTVVKTAYVTGYGYWDNTPAGSSTISDPVIHGKAGGTGTWSDPVTVAVGHSLASGRDVLDYPAGTRFYVPSVRKYFIAEDTCGDGGRPENIGCHKLFGTANGNDAPAGATTWIDVWVGGAGGTQAVSDSCENALTDIHTVVVNPTVRNYKVTAGDIVSSAGCKAGFGETPQTQ